MNYKTLAKEIIEKMEKKHICLYHSIQKETIISFIDDSIIALNNFFASKKEWPLEIFFSTLYML